MDILSHGLWGGLPFAAKSKRNYWYGFLFGLLPDLVSFMPHMVLMVLGPARHSLSGPPQLELIPSITFTLYNITHSFVVFGVVFFFVYLIRRRPFLPMIGWGLHVLLDIPTHPAKFFATPFLWPLSDFKVDGTSWSHPRILFMNYAILAFVYLLVFWQKRRRKKDRVLDYVRE